MTTPPGPGRAQRSRDGTIRLGVALAWALGIGGLMYIGFAALDVPGDQHELIALMGGIGAAAFILFFAGR